MKIIKQNFKIDDKVIIRVNTIMYPLEFEYGKEYKTIVKGYNEKGFFKNYKYGLKRYKVSLIENDETMFVSERQMRKDNNEE